MGKAENIFKLKKKNNNAIVLLMYYEKKKAKGALSASVYKRSFILSQARHEIGVSPRLWFISGGAKLEIK